MTRQYLLPALMCLLLAACGGQAAPPPATGFITANTPSPAGADKRDDGTVRDSYGRPYNYAGLGQPIPLFTAKMADGSDFSSDSLTGWTVIDVWGIWCSDCMADAPYVEALNRALADNDNFNFLSIHTPPSAARADEAFGKYDSVQAYFDAKGYSYPAVIDPDASIRDMMGISWTPSYLLVDPSGIVRGFRTEFAAAGETAVADFIRDIEAVRSGNQ